jgi:hypothetical protein
VVSFVLEAVPLNILRIERALHRLSPQLLADIGRLNGLRAQQESGGAAGGAQQAAGCSTAEKQRQGREQGQPAQEQ